MTSLLILRPKVSLAAGAEPVRPPITGLISKRVKPNNLLVARWAGALINASVNRLVAVPKPDSERIEVLVSEDASCPVVINETTSAWGNAGSDRTTAEGCDSRPVRLTMTR